MMTMRFPDIFLGPDYSLVCASGEGVSKGHLLFCLVDGEQRTSKVITPLERVSGSTSDEKALPAGGRAISAVFRVHGNRKLNLAIPKESVIVVDN